mmetsp:Transcript_95904/g.254775  ORF Transcript_95904/g.254775 Transcript_95904/m.254775 type:complete len:342 (-) Transcript_95904:590-1615(-)
MMAMSASLVCFSGHAPERRQTMRKESPMFLFGAPWKSSTQPCTISPTWFTKTMTFSFSTSVAFVKLRMLQKPMMASTFCPGTIASTPALWLPFMFCPMISAPASPKPSASSPPSLMMVFSRMTVSMGSLIFFAWHVLYNNFRKELILASCSRRFTLSISSRLYSRSPSFMASSGLSLMVCILAIMRSIGLSNNWLALTWKDHTPMPTAKQMKMVWSMLSPASSCVVARLSKAKTMSMWCSSESVFISGMKYSTSEHRNSSSMEHIDESSLSMVVVTATPKKAEHLSVHGLTSLSLTVAGSFSTGDCQSGSTNLVSHSSSLSAGRAWPPRNLGWLSCASSER